MRVRIKKWGSWGFEGLVLLAMGMVSTAIWWPIRYLPFWGEAATLVVDGTKVLVSREFQPLALVELETARPPLFMVVMAIVWKLWGDSRLVTHAVMVPMMILLMWGSYRFARKWFEVTIAIGLGFLVGFYPVVVAEYEMVSIELAMASVVVWSLTAWFNKKQVWAQWLLLIASFFQWTAILVSIVYGYWYWKYREDHGFDYRWLLLPFGGLLVWFMYHSMMVGWWFTPPSRMWVLPSGLVEWLRYFGFVGYTGWMSQGKWLLIGMGAICGVWIAFKKLSVVKLDKQLLEGAGVGLLVSLIVFSLTGDFWERRIIFLLPLVTTACLVSVKTVVWPWLKQDQFWVILGIVVLVTGMNVFLWKPDEAVAKTFQFRWAENLQFQDLVAVGRLAAGYVQGGHANAEIYGGLPEGYQISRDYMGYVTVPLKFNFCSNFEYNSQIEQLVYIHPYHPTQTECVKLLHDYQNQQLKRFESNDKWIELYKITGLASDSGLLQSEVNSIQK